MSDLEGQIAAWVDAENDGIDPVTADEAIERQDAVAPAARRPLRSRRLTAVVAAAAAILVGSLALAVVRSDGPEESVKAGPSTSTSPPEVDEGWKAFTEPELGWTLQRPISSTVQSWKDLCMIDDTGSLITLSPQRRPVERQPITNGCTTAWSNDDLSQPGFVAVQVSHHVGGPYVPPDQIPEDTPPGLAFGNLRPEADSDGRLPGVPGLRVLTTPVVLDGDQRYSVTAWIADDADPADLADLRRLIRSIRWDGPDESRGSIDANASGNPRTSTFTACMRDRGHDAELLPDPRSHIDGEIGATVTWGDGVQQRASYADDFAACQAAGSSAANRLNRELSAWPPRAGPSQTAAEAERDGVLPEVAALPLAERAVATTFIDTDEGAWAFAHPADRFGGAADENGSLGDPAGRFGVDFVNSHDYGEVVLVDPDDGRLLRAYPFPGLPLTWMRVAPDAVYAGRWGDGGAPDSVIVRIDRSTLEAEVVLFPHDDPAGPGRDVANDLGSLDPAAMGWQVATADQEDTDYFGGQDLPDGVLADASLGLTMLDRAALEDLFA